MISTGYRSPLDYLRRLTTSIRQNHTNEWPYVPVKLGFPRQSPIDLITNKAVTRPLRTLEIVEPDLQGHQAKFYNSGHTGKYIQTISRYVNVRTKWNQRHSVGLLQQSLNIMVKVNLVDLCGKCSDSLKILW